MKSRQTGIGPSRDPATPPYVSSEHRSAFAVTIPLVTQLSRSRFRRRLEMGFRRCASTTFVNSVLLDRVSPDAPN